MSEPRKRERNEDIDPHLTEQVRRTARFERQLVEGASERYGERPREFDESGYPVPQHTPVVERVRQLLGV